MNSDLFSTRLAKLRAERVEADRDLDHAQRRLREARREHAGCKATVERLTFAIAQIEAITPPPKASFPGRLDIAEAVFAYLFDAGPHEVGELAAMADRKRSQVAAACTRLSMAGRIELVPGTTDRYRIIRQAEEQRAAE